MILAAPERLLSRLLEADGSLGTEVLRSEFGASLTTTLGVLQRRGYRIKTSPETCSLATQKRLFNPQRFYEARQVLGPSESLSVWAQTASTNDLAQQAGEAGAQAWSAWVAEEQTAGRGRQGRSWLSAPGHGLLFSLLLRAPLRAAPRAQLLPLFLGLAAAAVLREQTSCPVLVKWPNDLLIDGCKLGGMLVEARSAMPERFVVGMGINFFSSFSEAGAGVAQVPGATALDQHVERVPAREVVLAHLLARFRTAVSAWQRGEDEAFARHWQALDALQGRSVGVVAGTDVWRGEAAGINRDGQLRLRLPGGEERTFSAAEVHLE